MKIRIRFMDIQTAIRYSLFGILCCVIFAFTKYPYEITLAAISILAGVLLPSSHVLDTLAEYRGWYENKLRKYEK